MVGSPVVGLGTVGEAFPLDRINDRSSSRHDGRMRQRKRAAGGSPCVLAPWRRDEPERCRSHANARRSGASGAMITITFRRLPQFGRVRKDKMEDAEALA